MCTFRVLQIVKTKEGEAQERQVFIRGIEINNKPKSLDLALQEAIRKAKKLFPPLPAREERKTIRYYAGVHSFYDN